MKKRVLAVALLGGLGIGFAGNAPANAAATSIPAMAAPIANTADTMAKPVGGCPWDFPVVSMFVTFFELLRDDEFDPHCESWHFSGEQYYRRGYRRRPDW